MNMNYIKIIMSIIFLMPSWVLASYSWVTVPTGSQEFGTIITFDFQADSISDLGTDIDTNHNSSSVWWLEMTGDNDVQIVGGCKNIDTTDWGVGHNFFNGYAPVGHYDNVTVVAGSECGTPSMGAEISTSLDFTVTSPISTSSPTTTMSLFEENITTVSWLIYFNIFLGLLMFIGYGFINKV